VGIDEMGGIWIIGIRKRRRMGELVKVEEGIVIDLLALVDVDVG
jgi:hypothetical protein